MFELKEKFLKEVYSVLFKEGSLIHLRSSGGGYSGSYIDFNIPPTEYFNLTKQYDHASNIVSHFTSFRNLHSILNYEIIRLYNLHNMNDKTEYSYSLPKEHYSEIAGKKEKLFVLSGCDIGEMKKSEIFKMWNDYGENGFGARLELEITPKKYESNVFLKRVVYQQFDTTELFELKAKFEKKYGITNVDLFDTLISPCILHKNEQNDLEHEVRLVYFDSHFNSSPRSCWTLSEPFFEEYSYESKKYCKYYQLKLNDIEDIASVRIKKIELGYKHKNNQQIIDKLRTLCLAKLKSMGQIQVSVSDIENIYN